MNNTTTHIDNGGPAFPFIASPESHCVYTGMTLSDWFAGQAMSALIVDPERFDQTREECARLSYLMADAMLSARNAKP